MALVASLRELDAASARRRDLAEEAVFLVARAGGEVDVVGLAGGRPVAVLRLGGGDWTNTKSRARSATVMQRDIRSLPTIEL